MVAEVKEASNIDFWCSLAEVDIIILFVLWLYDWLCEWFCDE
jgi:hypothetical protein